MEELTPSLDALSERKKLLELRRSTLNFAKDSMIGARELHMLLLEGMQALIVCAQIALDRGEKILPRWQAAIDEANNDFPRLAAQAVILTWSMFEVSVEHMMVTWLRLHPELLKEAPIGRLKLPVDTLTLDIDEQLRRVLRSLKNETYRADDIFTKLENVSKALKLPDTPVPESDRTNIRELFSVRGILVHRGGLVDTEFVSRCGWIDIPIGSIFPVTNEKYMKYAAAADNYANIVIDRLLQNT